MDTLLADDILINREMVEYLISRINTGCPGVIESFDPDTQTVTVTPAIKTKVIVDNVTRFITPPRIIKAPVIVPTAAVNGFILTLPITQGDPCYIHFSQRCIDNWLTDGGIQEPEDAPGTPRHHALTDALVVMAPTPLPQKFADWLTTGMEMRNRARTSRVTVLDDRVEIQAGSSVVVVKNDGTVTVTAPEGVTVDTPTAHFTGDIEVDGQVIAAGDIQSTEGNVIDSVRSMAAGRMLYDGHTHAYVNDSGTQNTSVPDLGHQE